MVVEIKTYILADIHGRYEALLEVLKSSNFDYKNDRLITLGDIIDGGDDSKAVVDELLKIKNRIDILGNHELWLLTYIKTGIIQDIWYCQGGKATIESYERVIPQSHKDFFNNMKYYHIENNDLFVHGGFCPILGFERTPKDELVWDRELIEHARFEPVEGFRRVFVGHTGMKTAKPEFFHNLIACDANGGWNGRLALLELDNPHNYYLSDFQKAPKRIW